MERLTEKQSAGYDLKALSGEWCNHYCHKQRVETCTECGIYEAIQKLAQYEDLEEQGQLVILPCKIGTRIYRIVPDLSVTYPDPPEYKVIWDTFRRRSIK